MTVFSISPSGSLHHTSIGGAEFVLPHLGSKSPAAARHSEAELVPAAEESPCAPLSVSESVEGGERG